MLLAVLLLSAFEPDAFLSKLTGTWRVTGKIENEVMEPQRLDAAWTLEQRFLELHFTSTAAPAPGMPAYEVRVFMGSDDGGKTYIAYWLDVFGAKASEKGRGAIVNGALQIVYEYPTTQFRNTFTPKDQGFRLLIESKGKNGKWDVFADQTLARVVGK